MIAVRDLSFSYGAGAFRMDVPSLDIVRGAQVAIIGPSGSGKTSLISLICGILKPAAGSIRVAETELTALGDADRRAFRIRNIGLVFQEFELLDYLTARENILLPFKLTNTLKRDDAARGNLRIMTESAGIADRLDRYPRTLSHGEKQRVAICRALITGPQLVVADEPTGSLDPQTARNILDLLLATTFNLGSTLIVVTHNHDLLGVFQQVIDMRSMGNADTR